MLKNSETKPKNSYRNYQLFALKIVGNFGIILAVPVVIFAIIGQKLDENWGTKPVMLTTFMILSAIFSGRMIYKKAKIYGKEFQDLDKK